MTSSYRELDVVALRHDRPAAGLQAGMLGTVVMRHDDTAFDVEFVADDGTTLALLTLRADDVYPSAIVSEDPAASIAAHAASAPRPRGHA